MTAAPSYSSQVTYKVLLFGALKDAARSDHIIVHASSTLSVSQLLQATAQQFPLLEKYLPHVRIAVNCEYSAQDQTIGSGDEIALLPPVAGGTSAL